MPSCMGADNLVMRVLKRWLESGEDKSEKKLLFSVLFPYPK
jgi:hypothetical protein